MMKKSLAAWLSYLETLHPNEMELGLGRIAQVAKNLSLLRPLANQKVITVAGTNGKGSCVATLEYLLPQTGRSVGVYSSPHLLHYCERIRVDGQMASEDEVCAAFERIDQARGDISLTYFEFGTLAALDVFRRRGVDVIVLEVGLGGRLDAVNILDADVSVVTSIAVDHEDWLGSDREVIGREKAGIFRADRPAICADLNAPKSIATVAAEVDAKLIQAGLDFSFTVQGRGQGESWQWQGQGLQFSRLPIPQLPLPSVAAAIQALVSLGFELQQSQVESLSALSLAGRFQQQHYQGRHIILDVAHNPAASEYLAQRLQQQPCVGKTLAVVAMMADKDRANTLAALQNSVDQWFTASLSELPRAASAQQLAEDLRQLGAVSIDDCDTVAQALAEALAVATEDDRILVLGSFFTVAAVLSEISKTND